MELETVLYRVEGNVGIVSLNRTKALNAMSKQIFVDLTTAFDAAEKDDTVRCVVVNAEGRAFCAGGDIPEMKGLDNPEAVFDFYNVAGIFMKKMINFVKPTITVAHGAIAGAGTSLLLAGDIALVSDDAMFMVAFGAVGLTVLPLSVMAISFSLLVIVAIVATVVPLWRENRKSNTARVR